MDIQDVKLADERIAGAINRLPAILSKDLSDSTGGKVYFKLENQQRSGSFKVRGLLNKIALNSDQGKNHQLFVTCGSSNWCLALAVAAESLRKKSIVVVPKDTQVARIAELKRHGCHTIIHGDTKQQAEDYAISLAAEEGALWVPPTADADTMTGYATVGLEVLEQLPATDVIIVPCGSGGLLGAVAAYAKQYNPKIKVIGVQPEEANAVATSFANKEYTVLKDMYTAAEALAVNPPNKEAFDYITRYVDDIVTVSESELAYAMLVLLERHKQVAELGGVAAVAAVLSGRIELADKNVVCIISGGNADIRYLQRTLERGLLHGDRRLSFHTVISDTHGSMQKVCDIILKQNANVISLQNDRLDYGVDLMSAILHVICEVSDTPHRLLVIKALEENGYSIVVDE